MSLFRRIRTFPTLLFKESSNKISLFLQRTRNTTSKCVFIALAPPYTNVPNEFPLVPRTVPRPWITNIAIAINLLQRLDASLEIDPVTNAINGSCETARYKWSHPIIGRWFKPWKRCSRGIDASSSSRKLYYMINTPCPPSWPTFCNIAVRLSPSLTLQSPHRCQIAPIIGA